MDQTRSRFEYMTVTPVPRLICRLAVPTILSMLVTGLYNAADTFFVGKLSTQATAAVGLVFSVMAMIQAVGFFCGQGSGSYISRMLGAGRRQEASEIAATGFALSLILGVAAAILGNVLARPLAFAIGARATTIHDTLVYMRIILIGAPFMMAQFVVNNQLRFQGSAMYAMVGLLTGAFLNIALDPLLISVFHMGVAGAAIATVSGQFVSFVVLLVGSRKGDNIRLKISNVCFSRLYLKEIINCGSPALFRQGLAAVSVLMLNHAAGSLGGDAAIAGMSVVTRALMLLSSALIGFGQGYQPVCGFNYGAGLYQRVSRAFKFSVAVSTAYCSAVAAAGIVFADAIVSLFSVADADVISLGALVLKFHCSTYILNGFIVLTNMYLQTTRHTAGALLVAVARQGLFFLPLLVVGAHFYGLMGIVAAQPLSDVLTFVLAVVMVRRFKI